MLLATTLFNFRCDDVLEVLDDDDVESDNNVSCINNELEAAALALVDGGVCT